MQPKPQGVYKVSAVKGIIGKDAIAPLHQKHMQDDIATLTSAELEAS